MRRIALASVLAILGAGCTPASADGCNPEIQDCRIGPRADAPARTAPAAYTYSVTPSVARRGSVCGENIPARVCDDYKRRFKAGLEKENAKRARRTAAPRKPRREARDEYRDERGRRIIDDGPRRRYRDEEERGRGGEYERSRSVRRDDRAECGREVEASGTQLPIASSARNSAITAWKRQVRFKYGERYAEWENARKVGTDGLDCVGSGTSASTFWKRCVATAIPCVRGGRD